MRKHFVYVALRNSLAAHSCTDALIVCPVLNCGLIALPPLPLVELFLPEPEALIDGQEVRSIRSHKEVISACFQCDKTIHITRRIVPRGTCGASNFYLQFRSLLDYWSFMDVVSEVKVKEASRLEDYRSQLSNMYDTIPSHSSTSAVGGLCSNDAHFVAGRLRSCPLAS